VAKGEELQIFRGHLDAVWSVVFSADGRHVLTGSRDGTTRLWDVALGEELACLLSLDDGRDWLAITPQGLFDGSAEGREKVAYRVGGQVVPVDRFFQDFYCAGLLGTLWKGERPRPVKDLAQQKAPVVRVVSHALGSVSDPSELTLVVEVEDQGGGIKGPWLLHRNVRLLSPKGPLEKKDDKTWRQTFRARLLQGDNPLEVHAACAAGSQESEPARLTVRYERPLAKPQLYVVVVGVSKYAVAADNLNLKFASADASAFAALFEKRGQALYEKVHVTSLLDGDATGEKVQSALREAAGKALPQDTLLVFLAGHGVLVEQCYYFLPHDFQQRKGKDLAEDVHDKGLPATVICELLGTSPALKRLLILDTCASGGAVDLFRAGSRSAFGLRGEVERLSRSQGICMLAAAAANQEAKESEPLGHGILTYALLGALRAVDKGPLKPVGDPPEDNRVIDVMEWLAFADRQVPQLAHDYGQQAQNVQFAGRGNFPVLPLSDPPRR
jgi:hypothetical protein